MSQGESRTARGKPRRKPRALVRGEVVVQRILAATMEELARVGYRALRVEDVAARAEVNKTTVYRRWPEKSGLVRDAMASHAERAFAPVRTGSLRGDLLELARTMVRAFSTPQGQSMVRMLVAEGDDAELSDIKRALRKEREPIPLAVLSDAIARGELSPDADLHLVLSTFFGSIQHRVFFLKEPADDAFLGRLVDLLLHGALRSGGARAPITKAPATRAPITRAPAAKAPAAKPATAPRATRRRAAR